MFFKLLLTLYLLKVRHEGIVLFTVISRLFNYQKQSRHVMTTLWIWCDWMKFFPDWTKSRFMVNRHAFIWHVSYLVQVILIIFFSFFGEKFLLNIGSENCLCNRNVKQNEARGFFCLFFDYCFLFKRLTSCFFSDWK